MDQGNHQAGQAGAARPGQEGPHVWPVPAPGAALWRDGVVHREYRQEATLEAGAAKRLEQPGKVKLPAMPPRAKSIILGFAEQRAVPVSKLAGRCRVKKVYQTRIEVAKALYECGYTTTRIGRWLNHDHTTIVFYLGRSKKKPLPPKWRTPKVRHVKFIRLPKEKPKPPRMPIRYAGYDPTESPMWRNMK